jgi:hypothetical protein
MNSNTDPSSRIWEDEREEVGNSAVSDEDGCNSSKRAN